MNTYLRSGVHIKIYRSNPFSASHVCIYRMLRPMNPYIVLRTARQVAVEWLLVNELGLATAEDLFPAIKMGTTDRGKRQALMMGVPIAEFGKERATGATRGEMSFGFVGLISDTNPWDHKKEPEEPQAYINAPDLRTVPGDRK